MPVGLQLPAGTLTKRGHRMDLSARPWGPSGDDHTPDPHTDQDQWQRFRVLHSRRYGPPVAADDPSVVDMPGLKHPEFKFALENIATHRPGWFHLNGLGACVGTIATTEEVFDAQAARGISDRIIEESRRIEFARSGAWSTPASTEAGPPIQVPNGVVTPEMWEAWIKPGGAVAAAPTQPHPLSTPDVRVEELRSWLWEEIPIGGNVYALTDQAWTFLRSLLHDPAWTALKPFAVELLRMWRLVRRHLGDTRPLP